MSITKFKTIVRKISIKKKKKHYILYVLTKYKYKLFINIYFRFNVQNRIARDNNITTIPTIINKLKLLTKMYNN